MSSHCHPVLSLLHSPRTQQPRHPLSHVGDVQGDPSSGQGATQGDNFCCRVFQSSLDSANEDHSSLKAAQRHSSAAIPRKSFPVSRSGFSSNSAQNSSSLSLQDPCYKLQLCSFLPGREEQPAYTCFPSRACHTLRHSYAEHGHLVHPLNWSCLREQNLQKSLFCPALLLAAAVRTPRGNPHRGPAE